MFVVVAWRYLPKHECEWDTHSKVESTIHCCCDCIVGQDVLELFRVVCDMLRYAMLGKEEKEI